MQKTRPSAQENVAKKKAQNAILFPVLKAIADLTFCAVLRGDFFVWTKPQKQKVNALTSGQKRQNAPMQARVGNIAVDDFWKVKKLLENQPA